MIRAVKAMFCQNCGKEMEDGASFCPRCGAKAGSNPEKAAATQNYNQTPQNPSTIIPFILGLLLGVFGVIIAVIVYSLDKGQYTKNPMMHALLWSLIGMFIWIPILIGSLIVLGVLAS